MADRDPETGVFTEGNQAACKYDPSYCDSVVELGKVGRSPAQIATALGICRNTLDSWKREYPPFCEALTRARTEAQSFWEEELRRQVFEKSQDVNTPALKLLLQARFREDYTEQTKIEHQGNLTVLTGVPRADEDQAS